MRTQCAHASLRSAALLKRLFGHASPADLTAALRPGPGSPPRSSGWSGSDTRSRSAGFRSWSPGRRSTQKRGVGESWAGEKHGSPAALPARCAARRRAPSAATTSAWSRRTTRRSYRRPPPWANALPQLLLLFTSSAKLLNFIQTLSKVIRPRGSDTELQRDAFVKHDWYR